MANINYTKPNKLKDFSAWCSKKYPLWCKSNFPFIEDTFEALDTYGLICKIVQYLNETKQNLNTTEDNVQNIYDFVSNYFDNLDVQKEINNKLDSMVSSGELFSLINNEIFGDINNKILQNSLNIGKNANEITNSVRKNEPNSITEEMLSQEVKESITGGSVAVVGENSIDYTNIKNNGIDLLNLSEELQSNFLKKFNNITLENPSTGYWYINNGVPTLENNANYRYYTIPLIKGKIYKSLSYNSYFSSGIMVVDNLNNLIFASNLENDNSQYMKGFYFRCNKENLIAYISVPIEWNSNSTYIQLANIMSSISILDDTEILLKDYEKIKLINLKELLIVDNGYITINKKVDSVSNFVFPQVYISELNQNYKIKIFYIQKGQKIKVKYFDGYSMTGLVITDINNNILYISSESNLDGLFENVREFTAEEDGYMYVSYNINYDVKVETYTPFNNFSNLENKSLYGDGDSIAYGYGNNGKSYLDMIAQNNSMNLTKKAVSGTTIAKRNGYESILERVENSANNNENYDYIILEGGINDVFQNIELGNITHSFSDELNEYTFSGALESICKILVTKFSSSKFMFLLTNTKTNQYYESQKIYWNIAKEIFKKWSIPYLDLSEESGCLPINNTLLNTYFFIPEGSSVGDGTHPNNLGYETFYNSKITNKLNSL